MKTLGEEEEDEDVKKEGWRIGAFFLHKLNLLHNKSQRKDFFHKQEASSRKKRKKDDDGGCSSSTPFLASYTNFSCPQRSFAEPTVVIVCHPSERLHDDSLQKAGCYDVMMMMDDE